jgi:hypothetical protein
LALARSVEKFYDVADADPVDTRELLPVDVKPALERGVVSEAKGLGISIGDDPELGIVGQSADVACAQLHTFKSARQLYW